MSKRFISCTVWGIGRWPVFFSVGTIFGELLVVLLIADLTIIMLLPTWNLIDFRVAEKEKLLKQYQVFVGAALVITTVVRFVVIRRISEVISRKLIGQIVLHGPYDSSLILLIIYWFEDG